MINLNTKVKIFFHCLLWVRYCWPLPIHVLVTQTDNQAVKMWHSQCGWQELPVSGPYAFSLSVVTESWLLAGNIATQNKDCIFQVSSLMTSSWLVWCKGVCQWDVWGDRLEGRVTLGTCRPSQCLPCGSEAAFATAILDYVVTLRMKFCGEDAGEESGWFHGAATLASDCPPSQQVFKWVSKLLSVCHHVSGLCFSQSN